MSDKNYRIRTNVGKDQVVHVNLEQDNDFLEILSLKIKQTDVYKLHVSNYGVIVGRVIANENFGIPNAKVSVFVKLDDDDAKNNEIVNYYPYSRISEHDKNNRRYNLLPDTSNDDCYRIVGSFPNKRLVLDDDTQLEIFDKYWKYTTTTNQSGDYMIFGVPSGTQEVHVDVDLSDIGILSQKPIDFMYKGYNATQFDNPRQFKSSTNLDNLSQILSQNNSVFVYPFWGDADSSDVAITRCDIQVQYKFEPTCIFMGSIVSDNFSNNIGHACSPSKYAGYNRDLITSEGTIEMIRRTPDNLVEEFQIQGNRLIDGDGVWCYQIPMNLDYVGTDEFGNIVPTDDPKKGIATRTSVRFRISLQETHNEGVGRHRAKYLIPNVQHIVADGSSRFPNIESGKKFESCYEFGSATPDEYFRDMYWNKVYSVKNYIPRLQNSYVPSTRNYVALRSSNSAGNSNPIPFNGASFRLSIPYRVLCIIMTIVIMVICILNGFFSAIACLCIKIFRWKICPLRPIAPNCIGFRNGFTDTNNGNIEYFPCCAKCGKMKCSVSGCQKERHRNALMNVIQQSLSQEYEVVNLDFSNDWLNGCLYMPLWFWKKTKKKRFFFGLFSKSATNSFCSCDAQFPNFHLAKNCSMEYDKDFDFKGDEGYKNYHDTYTKNNIHTKFGVIKEFTNKNSLRIYYYAPGITTDLLTRTKDEKTSYIRLYSTDLILLGSLNSCDLDNLPNAFLNLPSTTANIPYISTIKQEIIKDQESDNNEVTEGYVEVTGMDWLHHPNKSTPRYGEGLLMDLSCSDVFTKPKSCVNLERMSELGVSLDANLQEPVSKNNNLNSNIKQADGMITRYELEDNETRAMFASLNHNGLQVKVPNPNTGYYTYKLRYQYPIDFDGRMSGYAPKYTSMMPFKTYDVKDESYVNYRFGSDTDLNEEDDKFFYENRGGYRFPLFNNSFYFYFGLHAGSTAIDKFNKMFYSLCYKDNKYPFTCKIETSPGAWCKYGDDDKIKLDSFATIIVKLDGVKTPYSYTLYDELNNPIMSEDGMSIEELMFGYEIKQGGNGYVKDKDGNYKKNGALKYYLTGEKVINHYVPNNAEDKSVYLDNGTYYLKVTDVNNNFNKLNVVINQVPISMNYETLELGDKYYDSISKKEDFCNDNGLYGEIIINGFYIDGEYYEIDKGKNIENNNLDTFDLYVKCGKKVKKVKISLSHVKNEKKYDENGNIIEDETTDGGASLLDYENDFIDCVCDCFEYYKDNDDKVSIKIWVPGTYNIKAEEYCRGSVSDNMTNVLVNIDNGTPFIAFINDAPLKFILGNTESPLTYNKNFMPNYQSSATNSPEDLKGWFNLHNEDFYVFNDLNIKNSDIWSDFIDITEDENGNLSDDTIIDGIKYKFDTMFNLSKTIYVVDESNASMEIKHSGGKAPILYQGIYPKYEDISEDYNLNDRFHEYYIGDSLGSTEVNGNYPNIVGYNATYYDSEHDNLLSMFTDGKDDRYNFSGKNKANLHYFYNHPQYNKLYYDNDNEKELLGNYFAAFTRNGAPNCQTIPYAVKKMPNNLDGSITEFQSNNIIYKGSKSSYFKGWFVDRRLDYEFLFFAPYDGTDTFIVTKEDVKGENSENMYVYCDWQTGRLSGTVINGIEMAYDSSYQIIGNNEKNGDKDKYEYSYSIKNKKTILNTSAKNKRFYKAYLKCGVKKYNILDYFWATDRQVNGKIAAIDEKKYFLKDVKPNEIYSLDKRSEIYKTCYNGDFNHENYPTRRLIDIVNIPTTNKLYFNISSCSYQIESGFEDDASSNNTKNIMTFFTPEETLSSSTYKITGETSEDDENELYIDCRNSMKPTLNDLSKCALDGKGYNVHFNSATLKDITINGYKIYLMFPTEFYLKCKMNRDMYNDTHKSFSEFPILIRIKDTDNDLNYLNLIKNTQKTNPNDILNDIYRYKIGNQFREDGSTVSNIKGKTDSVKVGAFGGCDKKWYFVNSSEEKLIAYDDDSNVKNVEYTQNFKFKKGFKNIGVFGTLIRRDYLNANDDNLSKNIVSFHLGSIYDVRPFHLSQIGSSIKQVEITENSENNENTDDTEPTDQEEPKKIDVQTIKIALFVDSSLYVDDEEFKNSGEIKYVNYENVNDKFNQQFSNYLNLTAEFRCLNRVTKNVNISFQKDLVFSDGKKVPAIIFDITFDEGLTGVFLHPIKYFGSALYIKMPNGLIYGLYFNIRK